MYHIISYCKTYQGCLEAGAQLTFGDIFEANDIFDLPTLVWDKLVEENKLGRPVTILQLTDYQARYIIHQFSVSVEYCPKYCPKFNIVPNSILSQI